MDLFIRKHWFHLIIGALILLAVIITAFTFNIGHKKRPDDTTTSSAPPTTSSGTDRTATTKESVTTTTPTQTTTVTTVDSGTEPTVETTTTVTTVETTTEAAPIFPVSGIKSEVKGILIEENGKKLVQGAVIYPSIENPENLAAFDRINGRILTAVEEYAEYANGKLLEIAKLDAAAGGTRLPSTLDVEYEIALNSRSYFTVVFNSLEYSGGASEFPDFKALTFNTSGNAVALSAVFSAAESVYKKRIDDFIIGLISEDPTDFYADYINLLAMEKYDGRWYFAPDGMVFMFKPYEISVKDAGVVRFTVPYAALSDIMKVNPIY